MLTEVKGLIIRTTDIRESDRMLTIYTEEQGIISALARGARSIKSRLMSTTTQFCYASFVLYGQGDKLWVKEASLVESFYGVRDTLEGLAVATYVTEVISLVGTEEPDNDIMRLCLNTLFALSSGRYAVEKVKAAFEIRLASTLGFMPDVLGCQRCGRQDGEFFFDIMAGAVECSECRRISEGAGESLAMEHESHIICILTEGARIAVEYCIYAPLERLFSFSLTETDMRFFSKASEEYLVNHVEKSFKSLDFYYEVKGLI